LVPEVPAVYELLTTWEHLEFIARAFALDGWQPEAEALLRRYHLWEKRDALAATLSKGQRQKLLICGALLHQPEVFLFDEPLVGEVPAVYELLTTWEHLEFIARAFALDGWQPEAEALLRRYHLWEKRDALAATLSKGQRQKLLICGALLHQPEVFLFDEPLVG